MREHRIRRLPVLNLEGELEGILSMNDIVLKAKSNGKQAPIILLPPRRELRRELVSRL